MKRWPIAVAALAAVTVHAQSIEPRAYSNAPVGVNFIVAGAAYTSGGLSFDPSLPVDDEHLRTTTGVFAYARTLDLWGDSGKFDVIIPYSELRGTAEVAGTPITRDIHGLGDPALRLSVNLYGAPAMPLKEFAAYQSDLIVGVSLQVTPPLGQYDSTKIVNLSGHRWVYKPELGIAKTEGPWTLELKASASIFTDNTDFNRGQTRKQDPIYAAGAHAIYNFPRGIWLSVDATYFTGGRSSINGAESNDLQQNWRAGTTFAFPIDRRNSLKLYASRGLYARTGNSFDLIGAAWQYRWGAGL